MLCSASQKKGANMKRRIDPKYYARFRARGYGAAHAAYLARGYSALLSGRFTASYENDRCECDADKPCPYTYCVVVKSVDGENQYGKHTNCLGGVCVLRESDPYLDEVAAELACELQDRID